MILRKPIRIYLPLLFGIVFFIVSRVYFLATYPIFNDESINITSGRVMVSVEKERYLSLSMGKQPLSYWLYGFVSHFGNNPVLFPRLFSFFISIISLILLFKAMELISSRSIAQYSVLIYAVSPIFLLYDVLALQESAVIFATALTLFVECKVLKKFSFNLVALYSVIMGMCFWSKSTIILPLCSFLLYLVILGISKKIALKKTFFGLLMSVGIFYLAIFPLVSNKEFSQVISWQNRYALSVSEIVKFPLLQWYTNAKDIVTIYSFYGSIIVSLLFLFIILKYKIHWNVVPLYCMSACLVGGFILSGRILQSRYVYIGFIPILMLVSYHANEFKKAIFVSVIIGTIVSFVATTHQYLYYSLFPNITVLALDKSQYVTSWPSGFGLNEVFSFIQSNSLQGQIFVGVRWDPGNPEDAIVLFHARYPNAIVGILDPQTAEYQLTIDKYKHIPMYLVTRKGKYGGMENHLELYKSIEKPGSKEAIEIFRYHPQEI